VEWVVSFYKIEALGSRAEIALEFPDRLSLCGVSLDDAPPARGEDSMAVMDDGELHPGRIVEAQDIDASHIALHPRPECSSTGLSPGRWGAGSLSAGYATSRPSPTQVYCFRTLPPTETSYQKGVFVWLCNTAWFSKSV
jgi:hypothetical protein